MPLTRRNVMAAMAAAAGIGMPWVRRASADQGVVNVYNWADYIGESTIADFTKETGIQVVYDMYASSEEMEAKMLAGSSGYDVVLQAGLKLPQMVKAKVYQKLDKSKLPNWKNLDPEILQILQGFDPGNGYGVPYTWGTVGFTYNMDMVKKLLPDADFNSLDTIMNPDNAQKLASCGLSILDSPTDIGPVVMKWLGIDPNKAGPDDYKKLAKAFAKIRPYIATFDNTNFLTTLPNGEVCAVNTWSGDYGVAKKRAADAGIELDLEYFVPKSGAPAWFDVWAIPSDAKNADNAYVFLNYMLRPEVVAAATNFIGYANANKAATPLVDKSITSDPAIYPNAETKARLFTLNPMTPEQEETLTRTWTEIKTGG
ncbi:polyamine ABC transporter substrate-binding protein [Aestuariivirga sp.]|uniref:polyamine ABC transporter substrate-binding protein n=1 Tax=Aestuariivirga sp. TaxID=2650926 RepID=UPI0025BE8BAB|nr:polyamine ABC transporter substrate-binding protein [Aestuariivirga sp.]